MFIFLEGLDRSGKSTVAEYYRKKGFEVIHLNAPDKKYSETGYTGPSYVDEILDLFIKYDGKDVVWDRTHFGEKIWPKVYNRNAMLTDDDYEIFEEYENRNNAQKILMIDEDVEAHWKRCVENKEPLTKAQFIHARKLYANLAHSHNFMPKTLKDFDERLTRDKGQDNNSNEHKEADNKAQDSADSTFNTALHKSKTESVSQKANPLQEKLEKANAINSILSKRIIKQKGEIFDSIEQDIKSFLDNKLSEIMGTDDKPTNNFSDNEVQMLKTLCKQWESKLKG